MTNKELKERICNNQVVLHTPLILKYTDNTFICREYTKAIIKNLRASRVDILSLSEIPDSDLTGVTDDTVYILDSEKLVEDVSPALHNLIIICKSLPSDCAVDYVEILPSQPWQIEAFVHMRATGLSEDAVKWLCEAAKYDIYRLESECKKLEVFPPAEQPIIFDQIDAEGGFCDLNTTTIFNFANAIIKKNLTAINTTLQDLKYIDIEGTGLITILKKQLRNLISIQLSPKTTAESLGMKPGQFWAISQNKGIYTEQQLVKMYDFLTSFDQGLKSGRYSFAPENRTNNAKLVEYITTKLLTLGGAL